MLKPALARPQLLVVDDEIPVLKVIERLAARRALYRRLERHHIDQEPARISARRSV